MTDARVLLWGKDIAAVTWDDRREIGVFQYAPEFLGSGIEVAPLTMPLREGTYQFPSLPRQTFKRLPGLLADSLPDKFGNALIDAWLASQGRTAQSFNPVERLCYIGTRGIGALEFQPTIAGPPTPGRALQIDALVQLASRVLTERESLSGTFSGTDDAETIQDILRVGTSAGGARAKAILAWNETTGEFRSGQLSTTSAKGDGFTQWIMKFDGISNNRDKELADPMGFGLIEYAYHLMAVDAGIQMTRCRVHHEGGRAHFMTQRFDRTAKNKKLHMQSLCGMQHYDFNLAGGYSYEQAMQTIAELRLPMADFDQQFRRAAFNVITRNQDDHVKNIAFLMNKRGEWRLSPAFDITYAYNPDGAWTSQHQMSINGKRDHFEMDDLISLAKIARLKPRKARQIIDEVQASVASWERHADTAGVPVATAKKLARTFRQIQS